MANDYRITCIGKRIKELRTSKGMSQQELADACEGKVARTTINVLENKKEINPTISVLYVIADALNVSISELLIEEDRVEWENKKKLIANGY